MSDDIVKSTAYAASADPMMTPLARAEAFIESARLAAANGLTWREFIDLLFGLLKMLVAAYDQVSGMDGAAKKAMVIDAAGKLFDTLADRCVPLVAWPLWVVLRPAARSLVLSIASGAVEAILPLVR